MSDYQFNPLDFGFVAPDKMPEQIKFRYGSTTYVKVLCRDGDGTFWFTACYQMPSDERWLFMGSVYDNHDPDNAPQSTQYMGCITSDEFARMLLTHILGTASNEGTLKYGEQRMKSMSL